MHRGKPFEHLRNTFRVLLVSVPLTQTIVRGKHGNSDQLEPSANWIIVRDYTWVTCNEIEIVVTSEVRREISQSTHDAIVDLRIRKSKLCT